MMQQSATSKYLLGKNTFQAPLIKSWDQIITHTQVYVSLHFHNVGLLKFKLLEDFYILTLV